MMEYRFCPKCGLALGDSIAGGKRRRVCGCGFVHWHNPVPAAGVVLLRGDRVLWVRRAGEPFRGAWSLPSGFLEWDESIRDCAIRETLEETGIDVQLDGLLGVYSCFDDPRGHSLLVVYMATAVEGGGKERAGDDADAIGWYPIDSPPELIAWESHKSVLMDLVRLRDGGVPD